MALSHPTTKQPPRRAGVFERRICYIIAAKVYMYMYVFCVGWVYKTVSRTSGKKIARCGETHCCVRWWCVAAAKTPTTDKNNVITETCTISYLWVHYILYTLLIMFSFQALKMCILFSIENYRGVVYNAMNVQQLAHQLSTISMRIFSGMWLLYLKLSKKYIR